MAAVTGVWRQSVGVGQVPYATELKQGTGASAVLGIPGGPGRNTAAEGSDLTVDHSLTDQAPPGEEYGYTDEDMLWGYGTETGTADRAPWGTPEDRVNTDSWPAWGPDNGGPPNGGGVRSIDHGAQDTYTAKKEFNEAAFAGWENKQTGDIEDSVTSDPSQYEMQTSMVQRDKVRAGSQRGGGSASDFDQPIASRIVGKRLKFGFGGDRQRHEDMQPKEQNLILRPFWLRTAGTGNPEWMEPNSMYESTPMQRTPPGLAPQGDAVNVGSDSGSYGFTDEDSVY